MRADKIAVSLTCHYHRSPKVRDGYLRTLETAPRSGSIKPRTGQIPKLIVRGSIPVTRSSSSQVRSVPIFRSFVILRPPILTGRAINVAEAMIAADGLVKLIVHVGVQPAALRGLMSSSAAPSRSFSTSRS
jgi:hypothetical protein